LTLLDWVAVAVIVGGLVFLRRQIVALGRRASAAARKRPVFWIVPLVLVGLLFAWKGPDWQLASRQRLLTPREYLELQNSYRATIVQALGGLFLLLGIYFTWRRVTATERQVEIAGEGQITERFTRAIEHLGSEKLEVRLGGIYALERIARDSEKDHWTIMEVLTAFVRENAPVPKEKPEAEKQRERKRVAPAIQAVLTVIGRRRVEFDPPGKSLELRETDLFGADLFQARLSLANLPGAHLSAGLLLSADLSRANLSMARLPKSDLSGANLAGARLREADLSGAELFGADLRRANLRGADLSKVIGLTREQIESAITDEKTILPDYLKEGGEEPPQEAEGGDGKS